MATFQEVIGNRIALDEELRARYAQEYDALAPEQQRVAYIHQARIIHEVQYMIQLFNDGESTFRSKADILNHVQALTWSTDGTKSHTFLDCPLCGSQITLPEDRVCPACNKRIPETLPADPQAHDMGNLLEWQNGELSAPAYIEIEPGRFRATESLVKFTEHDDTALAVCTHCKAKWLARDGNTGAISSTWWQCPNGCWKLPAITP